MKLRYEAVWEIHQFLTKRGLAYAIIGGMAVQKWSDPRFTRDVDLAVAAPLPTGSAPLVRLITGHFPSRSADPVDFAGKTRMVLITASRSFTKPSPVDRRMSPTFKASMIG